MFPQLYQDPGVFHLPSILLLFVFFFIPLAFQEFRQNPRLLKVFWFILILHQVVPIFSILISPPPGADIDAQTFHFNAVQWAQNTPVPSEPFELKFFRVFLGGGYKVFGCSQFFGNQLSILFFVGSCVFFVKFCRILSLKDIEIVLLAIWGCIPSNIIFTSVTLRESYQLFFFMGTVYFVFQFIQTRQLEFLLFSLLCGVLMGSLHHGLMIFFLLWSFFIFAGFVFHEIGKKSFFILPVVLLSFAFLSQTIVDYSLPGEGIIRMMKSGKVIESINFFRSRQLEVAPLAKTNYGLLLNNFSIQSLGYSSLKIVSSFLFAPFPLFPKDGFDFYALLESFFRFIFLLGSIFTVFSKNRKSPVVFFLFALYLSLTFWWSLGVTNYGTAMRHHVIQNWIIILLGLPIIHDLINRCSRRILPGPS